MEPLYILTRTSGRPEFFRRCRESVKSLQWPGGVVHIVHIDDPRSEQYVECDILVKGTAHGPNMGTAPYNLYNNRLLKAIPSSGWVAFLDDDDEYTEPDVFERVLGDKPDPKKIYICKAMRWNETVWPRKWGTQSSFQTECFVVHSTIAVTAKWWGDKGGDHAYTRQFTRRHIPLVWRDVLVAKAQEGKGHGKLIDIGGELMDMDDFPQNQTVWVKLHRDGLGRNYGKPVQMTFGEGRVFEKHGVGRVTFKGTEICDLRSRKTA